MNKFLITLSYLLFFYSSNSIGQIKLEGVIKDEQNNGLPNVTITIEGTSIKLISQNNGHFEINSPINNGTIKFNKIGFQTGSYDYTSNDSQLRLEVILKVQEELIEEVNILSTGYQKTPKERSTGSFQIISEKKLNQQVSTNIIDRLESLISGASVNRNIVGSSGLMIRGLSSFESSNNPLIILDNFPYEGDLENINPNDVENITILKDAAASSIWGAKAGNGVVVISTKNSQLNQPLKINLNTSISVGNKPNLFNSPFLLSEDFIEIEKFLFNNQHAFADTASRNHPAFTPVYELLFSRKNGTISEADLTQKLIELNSNDIRKQYLSDMYTQPVSQQYAINLSGGNNRHNWYFSSGLNKDINELYAPFNRINFNLKNSITFNKDLKLNFGVRYTSSKRENGRTPYNSLTMGGGELPPYLAFKDADEHFRPLALTYRKSYIDTLGRGQLKDWYYYMDEYKHINSKTTTNDILINSDINYNFTSWLTFNLNYQFEKQGRDQKTIYEEESYYTRNLLNQFIQISNDGPPNFIIPEGAIFDPITSSINSHSLRLQSNFNFEKTNHSINGLLGLEGRSVAGESAYNRFYGYDSNTGSLANVDYTRSYPHFISGTPTFIPRNVGFNNTTNRFLSIYTNTSYSYRNKYTFTFSSRRDASNLFGVKTNAKWNMLWSVGTGWEINKERFYSLDWLPFLKMRITHGISGNIDPTRSAITTINYSSASNPYTNHKIALFNQYGDPNLRWESVKMTNLAVDFSLKNHRLSGSVDYFIKRGDDLFGPAPIDYTTGTSITLTKNVANIKGRGIDVILNSLNINKSKFKWYSNVNFSWYSDKITNYYRPETNGNIFITNENANLTGVRGKPPYSLFSYKWIGLDSENGNPIGFINGQNSTNYFAITGDSTSINDLVFSGSVLPVIYGTFSNTISWKRLSVTAQFLYNFKYYYRRPTINYHNLFASKRNAHPDYKNRWQKPGDEHITNIPSMIYPSNSNRDMFYSNSEMNVEKGDHIRFHYLNIIYNFEKIKPLKNLGIYHANIYVNISNLGLIWSANKDKIDPEYRRTPPPSRIWTIGTRFSF